ncbi:amino acid permease [Planobispora longispora]|uniref:Transporter n=1 Tax=Planobispora longispora TaxID=28887 RepID=A0A8J3WA68_9ACTN|nr:amino acid permease [Planobispora longispora]BFE79322.1 amino acid permease [Planobispora longispora]GIH81497.1 transporter [Planobispora longispora]
MAAADHTTAAGGTTPRAEKGTRLGLPQAVALVVGNIVGTGIFLLPASLAAFGTVSILAFGIVTLGSLALAVVFGRLGRRIPASGGPYAYARDSFGEFPGFLNAWSFWITAWAGNAGIAVAWVGYVVYFAEAAFGLDWSGTGAQVVIGLIGLWIPALINLAGVTKMGAFQLITTVLKFAPLIFVAIVGLFFIQADNFGPFNATDGSWIGAVSVAAALVLFAYSGVESASIAAEKVKDPARNIGRASVYGTLACAALYMLGTVAVFGTVPHEKLVNSTAPFADAINAMFGGSAWGMVMAAFAIISGIGALNGWTLLVAEMPMAAARDGLFPKMFTRMRGGNVPWVGIVVGTVLTSITFVMAFAAENAFNTILLLATFTTVVPYLFSAAAQLFWLVTGERQVSRKGLGWNLTLAVAALLFTFWMIFGAGGDAVFQGTLMLLAGIPVYIWVKASRGEYGPKEITRTTGELR